ncbi:DoxX family protein [Rhodopseudomonas palustris]|uniref:DoxX family protein n=1 Tax=Rhodopseudomonas palustris TaxID=1076 RepID=A0A418VDB2_RHOPL|nr:DoxX family protein [Rhodopseudomonas palustris]RJF73996.1 DoxX family protein [Rhodopseudomonas palustris]
MRPAGEPRWVATMLSSPLLWHAARLALVSAYLLGGVVKLADFAGAVAEQEAFGLHPGWLWATLAIAVELGGSALVIADRLVWLGAGALGVLTFVAMLTANAFWAAPAASRWMLTNAFFEHLGLIAGLVLVAILSPRMRLTS